MNQLTSIPRIYLAGGMRSGWQDLVLDHLQQHYARPFIPLDPRQHGSTDENLYTSWDLTAVEMSDILFVYLEAGNPGGHGLALEVGFGMGMSRMGAAPKHVIFIEEPNHPATRYLGMVRACSDVVVHNLTDGLAALLAYLRTQHSGVPK